VAGSALVAAGLAIRQALMPLHSWFIRFVERAPLGVAVAFLCPQLAVYAHIHLVTGALPAEAASLLTVLGAATAVSAAALAAVQIEARRALAFLLLSQSGLMAFGLESHSDLTHTGVLLLWLVLALSTSGFAMTMAALEARRGPLALDTPAGSFAATPRMAIAFLVLGFASVGLPTTLGFVAEDLILQGSLHDSPSLGIALIVATGLNGITVMRSFFRLFHGTRERGSAPDLTQREWLVLTILLAALFFTGTLPGAVVGALSNAPGQTQSSSARKTQ
jgi:NADH-quinone oxidoreductase subunit M